MTLNLSIPEQINDIKPKITVIGIGGAGGNAVNTMINANVNNIEFISLTSLIIEKSIKCLIASTIKNLYSPLL